MNILVTGAGGFVGKNLVCNLANIRDGKNRTRPKLKIDEIMEYDLENTPQELDAFCARADFVFNLAGVNRPKDPEEFRKGNFGFASTLLDTLKKHRQAEIESGQCLTGAHKDDLEISINGKSARSFASQGQTRTAALSIKLAEREIFLNETGEYPILLLDDVLSELDMKRQEFVLNRIGGGQTLISCCEDEGISKRTGGRVLFINDGRIS